MSNRWRGIATIGTGVALGVLVTLTGAQAVAPSVAPSTTDVRAELADVEAALDAHDVQDAADAAAFNQLQADHAALQQDYAALQDDYDALAAEFAAHMATHDTHAEIGAAVGRRGTETLAQAYARAETTLGPLEVARVYDSGQGLPKAYSEAVAAGMGNGRTVIMSFKYDVLGVANGSYDQTFINYAQQMPTDEVNYWSLWHEQDAKIQQGVFTTAQFKAAWNRMVSVVRANTNNPNLRFMQIFTGHQFCGTQQPAYRQGTRFANQFVGSANTDAIGVDPYSNVANTETARYLLEPLLGCVDAVDPGLEFWVPETGVWYTGVDQAWRTGYADSLKWANNQPGINGLLWFNTVNEADFEIDDYPPAAAEYRELVRD